MTEFLRAWSDGDRAALDRLTPIVYDELHRLARRYMKGDGAFGRPVQLRLWQSPRSRERKPSLFKAFEILDHSVLQKHTAKEFNMN